MISAQQRAAYHQLGYLVLPGFKSPAEMAVLAARATEIVAAFDPQDTPGGRAIFTTREQSRNVDAYFILFSSVSL